MKQMFAALLIVAAAAVTVIGSQQQASPLTPQQQQQVSQMPTMPPDRQVKAESIDAVMAKEGMILLDVREPREIEELGGYESAINIPVTQLEKRLNELSKDKTYLTA